MVELLTCPDCRTNLVIDVMQSNAGFYVGSFCECGPYDRYSDYFKSKEDAALELELTQKDITHASAH